jgi:hypothetical protein
MTNEELLEIIRDPANNSATITDFMIFAHPNRDLMVHGLLTVIHDESGLKYRQLLRIPSHKARELSDELRKWAELVGASRPAF